MGSIRRTLLAAVALALAVATPAAARVQITPDRVVVAGKGARVVVERAPFRIAVADGKGRRVLQQTAGDRSGPFLIPPIPEPQPGGTDGLDGPTVYAPLTFTVGAAASLQLPATQWVGNELTAVQTGTIHSSREVIAARRSGRGARLEVSTTDPGRTLIVEVRPHRAGTIAISARPDDPAGVVSMSSSFDSLPDEAFRGFGGRHNALDQRGNDFYNWVEQQNVGAGPLEPVAEPLPGSGGETYQFPNGPAAAWYVQSQFISSAGYGFLLDRDELSGWRLASDRDDAWQVTAAAGRLDFIVAPGDARRAIRKTTAIGGRHRVPPRWALGPGFDRLTRFSGETAETYRAAVEADLRDIRRYELPLRSYRIEAWVWLERDFLRRTIRTLHRRGIRALLYFRPFVGMDEIGTDDPADFEKAISNGWVATTEAGLPYVFIGNFFRPTAMIDFTNPEAVRWWGERVRGALELGADGFMQDFGEQVVDPMHFSNGETGRTMHNRYPVHYHRTTRRIVDRWQRRHPRKIWFFTRAGYSGTPGSAAYEGSNFPGDETTDWGRGSGLRSLAPDMLNRGVGGAFGFGTDIGGYFDFHTPPATNELFIRWAEWAALSPLFRLHGSINAGTHAPWTFDEQTVRTYNRLSRLRLRAVPLIYRTWKAAARTGIPVARPLWLRYPNDPVARAEDQQWLLGPNVLVAPVVEEGATERRVYFPRGCWRSPADGRRFRGPRAETVPAPLGRPPYFVRCGTKPLRKR